MSISSLTVCVCRRVVDWLIRWKYKCVRHEFCKTYNDLVFKPSPQGCSSCRQASPMIKVVGRFLLSTSTGYDIISYTHINVFIAIPSSYLNLLSSCWKSLWDVIPAVCMCTIAENAKVIDVCWFLLVFWQCGAGYLLIIFCDSHFWWCFCFFSPNCSFFSQSLVNQVLLDCYVTAWLSWIVGYVNLTAPNPTSRVTLTLVWPWPLRILPPIHTIHLFNKHSYFHTHNHIYIQKKGSDDHLFIVLAYGIMNEEQSSD